MSEARESGPPFHDPPSTSSPAQAPSAAASFADVSSAATRTRSATFSASVCGPPLRHVAAQAEAMPRIFSSSAVPPPARFAFVLESPEGRQDLPPAVQLAQQLEV